MGRTGDVLTPEWHQSRVHINTSPYRPRWDNNIERSFRIRDRAFASVICSKIRVAAPSIKKVKGEPKDVPSRLLAHGVTMQQYSTVFSRESHKGAYEHFGEQSPVKAK